MTQPTAPSSRDVWYPRWRRRLAIGAGGFIVLLVLIGLFSTPTAPTTTPAWSAGSPATTYDAVTAPATLPAPSDFVITVKVLSKQCFDTAGCVLSYQISPSYVGSTGLTDKPLTVVYEVKGGQDGPVINNFTVTGTSVRFPKMEVVQTVSSGTVLTATATSVSGN